MSACVLNALHQEVKSAVAKQSFLLERNGNGKVPFLRVTAPADGLCAYHSALGSLTYNSWKAIARHDNGVAVNRCVEQAESSAAKRLREYALQNTPPDDAIIAEQAGEAQQHYSLDVGELSWLGVSTKLAIRCTISPEALMGTFFSWILLWRWLCNTVLYSFVPFTILCYVYCIVYGNVLYCIVPCAVLAQPRWGSAGVPGLQECHECTVQYCIVMYCAVWMGWFKATYAGEPLYCAVLCCRCCCCFILQLWMQLEYIIVSISPPHRVQVPCCCRSNAWCSATACFSRSDMDGGRNSYCTVMYCTVVFHMAVGASDTILQVTWRAMECKPFEPDHKVQHRFFWLSGQTDWVCKTLTVLYCNHLIYCIVQECNPFGTALIMYYLTCIERHVQWNGWQLIRRSPVVTSCHGDVRQSRSCWSCSVYDCSSLQVRLSTWLHKQHRKRRTCCNQCKA